MNSAMSFSQDKTGSLTGDEAYAEIQRRIALGVPVKRACEQVGIPRSTFYRWQEEKEKAGSPQRDPAATDQEDGAHSNEADDTSSPTPEGNGQSNGRAK
jgi:hypothetical protein